MSRRTPLYARPTLLSDVRFVSVIGQKSPFKAAFLLREALFLCMNPLVPQTAPNAQRLAQLARATARHDKIDPVEHLAGDRVYIFTGSKETDTLKIRFPLIRKRSGKRIFLKDVGE